MAIRNVEIRREGEGFRILEQAGSDPGREQSSYEAAGRDDAESWLVEQGGDRESVRKALEDASAGSPVYVELKGDWSEAENFPRR